jgi:hypothetical protein
MGKGKVWGAGGARVLERGRRATYFYLEEFLGRAVDLFEALLACIWHGLHGCKGWAQGGRKLG